METKTGEKVKTLRSDNGGEFILLFLAKFLKSKGIKTERSIPYHHYQNGVILHFNRTLQEMGRTLLLDSGLDRCFWGHAFQYAGTLLNRMPNKASGDLSPFKAMYNRKPNFERFKPFGSTGYVHIPAELRKKLDNRAYEGRMVGYLADSKGWTFWVLAADDFVDSALV
jgi:transposase InsO family protein